ncbi:Uncharacterized membrane protein [Singulisphaera sp. GP187]|uniref:glutamine amidotransferase n=1 Tax=Singulisphaera sp. GP187 TaxID=1882752 RepID=UPI000928F265|nr:glutamine amidotransferase [Singulisphaera sp. GP187]SIO60881.1 Uncharacterized membrane protein [Singulisphaera sp. GP187]
MNVSFDPISSWFVVAVAALIVTGLTVWAYAQRMRGTTGRWRWFALGLRLASVLLCVLAALRPSVILQEKKKQPASVVFLLDDSKSMQFKDEAGGKSRWEAARAALELARPVAKNLGPNLDVKYYRFNSTLREEVSPSSEKADEEPNGRETALGDALLEAVKRQAGTQVASLVVISDASNNAGYNPLVAARRLRAQQIPITAVGVGSESAGPTSKDISIRGFEAGPSVFVKNQLQIKGSLAVRGFPKQPIELEMLVDGKSVAKTTLEAPMGTEVLQIKGLKYIPQTPGEKLLTLRVKPKDQELLTTNNESSTFINVLSGGLNVLFIQGPSSPWEYKYWNRAVTSSPDIQGDVVVLRKPADNGVSELDDAVFAPGKYNVYILSDVPANFLSPKQQQLLTMAVEKDGAGLIMLGGRSSFGSGKWENTPIAGILPVKISASDGQLEPKDGIRFDPQTSGLENYLFQIGPTREESKRIWATLPPLTGTNRFGEPKANAMVLARSGDPNAEPLMIASDSGAGRVVAFGGETWVWPRASEQGQAAHRRFWRQVTFWLSHKEDEGEDKVKLTLDTRKVSVGETLGFTVTARDAKNVPIPNLTYQAAVTIEGSKTPEDPVPVYKEGEAARGSYPAIGQPGLYRVTVVAKRNGQEVGRDSSRFIVNQDDREMENPAADLDLLRQMAETTGGQYLPSEGLPKYLKSLNGKLSTESMTQIEHKIWDNWPFFLIFTAFLTLEWWLRKRHGWV